MTSNHHLNFKISSHKIIPAINTSAVHDQTITLDASIGWYLKVCLSLFTVQNSFHIGVSLMQLYTDAATTPDNQRSAAGILIIDQGQQHQFKQVLPDSDNHTAEFLAAIAGFKTLLDSYGPQVSVFSIRIVKSSPKVSPRVTAKLSVSSWRLCCTCKTSAN